MSIRNDLGRAATLAGRGCRATMMLAWLSGAAAMLGCGKAGNEYVEPPPPEVTFALPIQAPITPFVDQNGLTEAAYEAEVRGRVRGFLKSVEFQPGEQVRAEETFCTRSRKKSIRRPYESAQAAVQTAEAAIGVAKASVKIAQAEKLRANQDLDREERLKDAKRELPGRLRCCRCRGGSRRGEARISDGRRGIGEGRKGAGGSRVASRPRSTLITPTFTRKSMAGLPSRISRLATWWKTEAT